MMATEHGHLSDRELERYRGGRMVRAELLASDDHLTSCSDCSSRLWQSARSSAALESIENALGAGSYIDTDHLTFDQMAALVDGACTESDREVLNTHLAYCSQCSDEVNDLMRDKSMIENAGKTYTPSRQVTPARGSGLAKSSRGLWRFTISRWAIQAAAAAAIVLIVNWGVRVRLGRTIARLQSRIAELEQDNQTLEEQSRATRELEDQLAAALRQNEELKQGLAGESQAAVSLNDGKGRITVEKDGRLTGVDFLSPTYQAAVKQALAAGRVKVPLEIASLRGGSGTLMGASSGRDTYGLVEPVGTVVRSNRPAFHWRGVPGALIYEVTVYTDEFKEVAASGPLAQTTWIMKSTLERGKVYTWQVVTVVDRNQVVLPPAAAPRAKFKVLEEPAMTELERLERMTDRSHLALGVVYSRHGLLDESRREFQALATANPDSQLAKKLLQSIAAATRGARSGPY